MSDSVTALAVGSMSVHDRAEESKFAHLLQPIRDLAANWDINIANELEDYLVMPLQIFALAESNSTLLNSSHLDSLLLRRMFWRA